MKEELKIRCPKCGFWKLNEFMGNKSCKKCGYKFKTNKQLEDEKKFKKR